MQAHIGITDVQSDEGHSFIRNLICDKITAYTACQAVTAALLVRERTGEGQHIDLSMLDAGLFFIFPDGFMSETLLDEDVTKHIEIRDIYRMLKTSDGEITFSAGNEKQMMGAIIAIGREDLLTDEGLPNLIAMMGDLPQLMEMMQAETIKFTTEEMLRRLNEADVPAAKCLSLSDTINQPQIEANNTMAEIEHPLMGRLRAVRSPARFGGEQLPFSKPCPAHGENTHQVMQELGLSDSEIENLISEGKIL